MPRTEHDRARRVLHVVVAAVLLGSTLPGTARGGDPPATNPIVRASREHGIDLLLLLAVAKSESGFHAYALNIAGKAHFPRTRREAIGLLRRSGNRVDIGLFQVNYGTWGERMGLGKADLLDPARNANAAAHILKWCLDRHGLDGGVSCYHSGTPDGDPEYASRVLWTYETYQKKRSEIRLAP
jgi:soluble lytic murein transglycosylase-like protein